MGKVIWTHPALDDLNDIIQHIAKDSPAYSERFGIHVAKAPKRLVKFPYSGRIVPEFNQETIRELIYGSYRIIYLIKEGDCYVTAIIHGSRDILSQLKPGNWNVG
jgi:plasmid stabilization system protein ParE